jgi:hypothetical protein
MITTKINIKQHLAEYCYGKFSGCDKNKPVQFPDRMNIYHVVWNLLEVCPKTGPIRDGNLEIVLPSRSDEFGKDPRSYNYIGERSIPKLNRFIENIFYTELYDLLTENKLRYGIFFSETLFEFQKKYSITTINEETLWKGYYRWKQWIRRREKRGYEKKSFPI